MIAALVGQRSDKDVVVSIPKFDSTGVICEKIEIKRDIAVFTKAETTLIDKRSYRNPDPHSYRLSSY